MVPSSTTLTVAAASAGTTSKRLQSGVNQDEVALSLDLGLASYFLVTRHARPGCHLLYRLLMTAVCNVWPHSIGSSGQRLSFLSWTCLIESQM